MCALKYRPRFMEVLGGRGHRFWGNVVSKAEGVWTTQYSILYLYLYDDTFKRKVTRDFKDAWVRDTPPSTFLLPGGGSVPCL